MVIPSRYQKRVSWARAALLMQGLDDEDVGRALRTLTKPVELEMDGERDPEPIRSPAGHFDGSSDDRLMDCTSGDGDVNEQNGDVVQPQRQGNPRYDPLAELHPDEPEAPAEESEHSRANVKCKRHDDWIGHCGCRSDDDQTLSSKPQTPDTDPSEGYEYVLVEEADDDSENCTKENISRVNKTTFVFAQSMIHSALDLKGKSVII